MDKTADSEAVPLSPIIELDESSFDRSAVLELEAISTISFKEEQNEISFLEDIPNVSTKTNMCEDHDENVIDRQSSSQIHGTPPEVLRKRIQYFKCNAEDLESELKELHEFTKLEKQIAHIDCISREEGKSLKNELQMLKEKVNYVIEDNENLQNKIDLKDNEVKELKSALSILENMQACAVKTTNVIGMKISSFLKVSTEEVLENNPSLENVFTKESGCKSCTDTNLPFSNNNYSLEDVQRLVEVLLSSCTHEKLKIEELCLENEKLRNDHDVLNNKIVEIENLLVVSESERVHLQNRMLNALKSEKNLEISLTKSELKCTEIQKLLALSNGEINKHKKELLNVYTLDDAQQEFKIIFKEIGDQLLLLNNKNKFYDLVDVLICNSKLITCVNLVMNDETQTFLLELLSEVKKIWKSHEKEMEVLSKTIIEMNEQIKCHKNELLDTKASVDELNCEVHKIINFRLKEIEKFSNSVVSSNEALQRKCNELENKNKYLSKAFENRSNEKNELLEVTSRKNYTDKKESSNLESIRNCNNLSQHDKQTSKELEERVEELSQLKEIMALEITCLDKEERKDCILKYSANEIFNKLMQNIIKKEKEVTTDLRRRSEVELERVQEEAEKSMNKRKSMESWVNELQNENEHLSKEQIKFKEKIIGLENDYKTCSKNLKNVTSEITSLKGKMLNCTTENDILTAGNENLTKLLKEEKDLVRSLENDLKNLNEKLLIRDKILRVLNLNSNCTELLHEENYKHKVSLIKGEQKFKDEPVKVLSSQEWFEVFFNNFEMEQIFLRELVEKSQSDEQLGEDLLSNADNIFILKDIILFIAEKIAEIGRTKTKRLKFLEAVIINLTELCDGIKSDLSSLCEDVASGNLLQESETYGSLCTRSALEYLNIKEELQLMREECTEISSGFHRMEKVAEAGKNVTQSLRKEIHKMKEGSFKKGLIIEDLEHKIKLEQCKSKEKEDEIENYVSKISCLLKEKTNLENKIKDFTDQLSSLASILLKSHGDISIDMSNATNLIEYSSQILELSIHNKYLLLDYEESCTFFSDQLNYVISYVEDLEHKLAQTQQKNTELEKKLNYCTAELVSTKQLCSEFNHYFDLFKSSVPIQTSSLQEAIQVATQIFHDHKSFKESGCKIFEEQKLNQEKVVQQIKDNQILKNRNLDLKVQLESYEEQIRSLRSDLRNLRQQLQKKQRSRTIDSEKETQTENLCCKYLGVKISELEEIAEIQRLKITSLEHLTESEAYRKKISSLECALRQAKERIGKLRSELAETKNQKKEIIESLNLMYDNKSEL